MAVPQVGEGGAGPETWNPAVGKRLASRGVWLTLAPEPRATPALETQWSGPICRSRGGGVLRGPEGTRALTVMTTMCPGRMEMVFPFHTRTLETAPGN